MNSQPRIVNRAAPPPLLLLLALTTLLLAYLNGNAQCLSLSELQAKLGTTVTADDPLLKRQFTAATNEGKMIWVGRGNAGQVVVIQSPAVSLIGYQATDSHKCVKSLLRQIKSAGLHDEGVVADRAHGTNRRYSLLTGETCGVVVRRSAGDVVVYVCTKAAYEVEAARIRGGEPSW